MQTIDLKRAAAHYAEAMRLDPNLKAADFAKFLALAKGNKPVDTYKKPDGVDGKQAEQDFQRGELERSIKYCKETLGLGIKA